LRNFEPSSKRFFSNSDQTLLCLNPSCTSTSRIEAKACRNNDKLQSTVQPQRPVTSRQTPRVSFDTFASFAFPLSRSHWDWAIRLIKQNPSILKVMPECHKMVD
jgi:hypothetical protein